MATRYDVSAETVGFVYRQQALALYSYRPRMADALRQAWWRQELPDDPDDAGADRPRASGAEPRTQ